MLSQVLIRAFATMRSNLPAKLRAALERRSITARDLANITGFDESTVSLWLAGKRTPRVKNLEKIAKAIQAEMSEFWDGPEAVPATDVQSAMLDEMNQLDPAQQEALLALARTMRKG